MDALRNAAAAAGKAVQTLDERMRAQARESAQQQIQEELGGPSIKSTPEQRRLAAIQRMVCERSEYCSDVHCFLVYFCSKF